MSKCKCTEIEIYEDYIEILTNASTKLDTCSQQSANILRDLISLSAYSALAYDSNQAESVSNVLKELAGDMIAARTKFHQKVLTKKNELENDLVELKEKDAEFHAEEDKKLEAEKAATDNETVE